MKSSLQKLNEKIKGELRLEYNDSDYEEFIDDEELLDVDDLEDEAEEELEKSSKARIKIETESKIKGVIKNLEFEVNFRDLADRVNDEIDGVVLTREKAHKLFNILRDFLEF